MSKPLTMADLNGNMHNQDKSSSPVQAHRLPPKKLNINSPILFVAQQLLLEKSENERIVTINKRQSGNQVMTDSSSDIRANTDAILIQKTKEEELKKQYEVEQQKDLLIRNLLANEQELNNKLILLQEKYNNDIEQKNNIINNLQILNQNNTEELVNKMKKSEERLINDMVNQENSYKEKISEMIVSYEQKLDNYKNNIFLNNESNKLINQTKIDAKKSYYQKLYEHKLKKYEQNIMKVINSYNEKELLLSGTIEEIRREKLEIITEKNIIEKQLREELLLKDKKIIKIEDSYNVINDLNNIISNYKEICKKLSILIIQLSSTISNLPILPHHNLDLLDQLMLLYNDNNTNRNYIGISSDAKLSSKKETLEFYQHYQKVHEKNVLINKKKLLKILKFSKVHL